MRVLSGIQPTGEKHLGNFVGAIRRWVAEQHEMDAFHPIVDMHAITVPQEPEALRESTLDLAALLIACGLDPDTREFPDPAALRRLTFAETNFRTYVRAPDGRAGIYFFAIEAVSALMTISARVAAGIPYRLGNLSVVSDAGVVSYGGARRDGSGAYRLDVRPGPPIVEPTPLDVWLTARWRAYSWHLGRLLETPVWHEPWPLSSATVEGLRETLSTSLGLPAARTTDAVVHFSDGVRDVRIGASRRAR